MNPRMNPRIAACSALILDKDHRVFVERSADGVPRLPTAPLGRRPLTVFEARGLGQPYGSRRIGEEVSDRDFAFVVSDPRAITCEGQWLKLAEAAPKSDLIWDLYCELMLGGYRPPSRFLDVFSFGMEPAQSAKLLHLVIKGRKRATAGWVDALHAQGVTIPTVGLVSVVTDAFGTPGAVIVTDRADLKPFSSATSEFAACEGEGDLSLEDWMDGHRRYFETESAQLGIAFGPASAICFERFRVLKVLGNAD